MTDTTQVPTQTPGGESVPQTSIPVEKAEAAPKAEAPVSKPPASNEAVNLQGEVRVMTQSLAITTGEAAGTIYQVGNMPSNAIIDVHASRLTTAGVAGLTGDVGFYKQNGEAVAPDALATARDFAGATSDNLSGAGGTATGADKAGQPVWKMLGLASDPGISFTVAVTSKSEPTADGAVVASIQYVK